MVVAFPLHKLLVEKSILGLIKVVVSEDSVQVIADSIMLLFLLVVELTSLLHLLNKSLEYLSILLGEVSLLVTSLLLLEFVSGVAHGSHGSGAHKSGLASEDSSHCEHLVYLSTD